MRKVLNVIILLFVVLIISSCRFNPDPFDTVVYGDFIYSKYIKGFNGEEGDISIIGLSEEGKKKEVLVFPNYLDGHRVVAFGNRLGLEYTGPIEITNAKKIYFCNMFVERYNYCKTYFEYDKSKQYEVYIAGAGRKMEYSLLGLFFENAINYVDLSFINSVFMTTSIPKLTYHYNFMVSTISYYADEKACYFVDYVINDKVSVIPPDPYIKGYKFDGWYEDLTYTKEWDFNTIINPISVEKYYDEESEIEIEYEPVKVYAKWVKIEE